MASVIRAEARITSIATLNTVDSVLTALKQPAGLWYFRLAVHLALASIPVLSISAHVFGWVPMHVVALGVLYPLLLTLIPLTALRPDRADRVMLAGLGWGMVACAGYDAFRLPTIYLLHLWDDFIGSVGGWAINSDPNYLAGYLWRFIGDGGGIAAAFFAIAATLRIGSWTRRQVLAAGVCFGVFPVWTGLILTDLYAPLGRELFPLNPVTMFLSLIGHLIYGVILGYGYWCSRELENHWPLDLSGVYRT